MVLDPKISLQRLKLLRGSPDSKLDENLTIVGKSCSKMVHKTLAKSIQN